MAETNYFPNPGGNVMSEWHREVSIGTGAPTGTGYSGYIYIDDSTGDFYEYIGGTWVLQFTGGGGGGGTAEIATGSSDPVGAPAAGIIFFARTDVVRVLQWNGSAWVVIVSEI